MHDDEYTYVFDYYRIKVYPVKDGWTHVSVSGVNGNPVYSQIVENHLVTLVVLQAIDRDKRLTNAGETVAR